MAKQQPPIRALLFDVFGTCVDWRTGVTTQLAQAAEEALKTNTDMSDEIRQKASAMTYEDWGAIAQEWRTTYHHFTRRLATDPTTPWKSVDAHHTDALRDLLDTHALRSPSHSLFPDTHLPALAQIWHALPPWPDTNTGLTALNHADYTTATLSNGNLSLLHDMCSAGAMPFGRILSAEMWKSYKPDPAVYLGAVRELGCEPAECAMVAAHLGDLKAARGCGLRTVYVERVGEEGSAELVAEGRAEGGFVDFWVGVGEGGFERLIGLLEGKEGGRAEGGRMEEDGGDVGMRSGGEEGGLAGLVA